MFGFIKGRRNDIRIQKALILFDNISPALCEVLSGILSSTLSPEKKTELDFIQLKELTRKRICSIRDDLRKPCTLILFYRGDIPYEYYYKLGIAHALDTTAILVNVFCDIIDQPPPFVRWNFYHGFNISERPLIAQNLDKVTNIFKTVLENDLNEILYLKALENCERIKVVHQVNIDVVEFSVFQKRIALSDIDRLKELFIGGNNPDLYKELLRVVISDGQQPGKLYSTIASGLPPENQSHNEQSMKQDKTLNGGNDSPEVFISFKYGTDSEQIADQIVQALQTQSVSVRRDCKDLKYKDSIQAFMEALGRGKYVIAVIDDAYLKSENCMFELVEMLGHGKFHSRIFPIVLPDAQIHKPTQRIQYVQYWEHEIEELEAALRSVKSSANLQSFRQDIDLYNRIRATIAELTTTLKQMNTLKAEDHIESGFTQILAAIERQQA